MSIFAAVMITTTYKRVFATIAALAAIWSAEGATTLPDTTFSSTKGIEYVVEVRDTVTPPTIGDYVDRYDNRRHTLTFRGSAQRSMPQTGTLTSRPTQIEKVWEFATAYDSRKTSTGVWGGGSGWTGQPLYVEWSDEMVEAQLATSSAILDTARREVIVGSLSGEVYFINYDTGKASRRAHNTGNPIKGTVSLDPRLNGNLYIGQGIPAEEPIGAEVFNIFTHRRIAFYGRDSKSWRRWSAYDPSAVLVGDFIIRASENGTLYKLTADDTRAEIHSLLRYRRRGYPAAGMESSPAVWQNYVYFSDNSGILLCVNAETMRPVWMFSTGDDSDSSPVVAEEQGRVVLYSGTAVDKQGDSGYCNFTKLDALTGEKIWQQRIPCHKIDYAEKLREGGMFATPLLGRANCSHLIFSNICGWGNDNGTLVAIDRSSGNIVYRTRLDHYSWSSPVALCTSQGEMFIFTGDVIGNVYLIDALTGKIIFKKRMAWNFESSPVVIDDCVVVGTRGKHIYKFRIS